MALGVWLRGKLGNNLSMTSTLLSGIRQPHESLTLDLDFCLFHFMDACKYFRESVYNSGHPITLPIRGFYSAGNSCLLMCNYLKYENI